MDMLLNSRIRFNRIANVLLTAQVLVLLLIANSNSENLTEPNIEKFQTQATGKNPGNVESRFFGLDGIMGQLFPGFNQGHQGGSATPTNPGGMGFPANSQFYPDGTIQNTNPQMPSDSITIDDAKHFPQQSNHGMQQYPNQGSFGSFPQTQNPGQGNIGGQIYPGQGQNNGGFPPIQNPNQGNFGGPTQMQFPGQNNGVPNQSGFGGSPQMSYPNQGNFGGSPQMAYPNQGNFGGTQPMPYPNQGNFGASTPVPYPNQNNLGGSYPNQGNFGGSPQVAYPNQGLFGGSTQMPYPNQGNFGGSAQIPNPNQAINGGSQTAYPGNLNGGIQTPLPDQGNFGGSIPIQSPFPGNPGGLQNPTESSFGNQNGFGSGGMGDGTLDTMVPGSPEFPDLPNDSEGPDQELPQEFEADDGTTAILGRPVVIPPNTNLDGTIVFPDNSDTPSRRQCVQDCQTTSEYNPVCGTNNVTYINPGKFVCARNCGVEVYVSRRGRCPTEDQLTNPKNVLPTTRPVNIFETR